MNFFEWIGQMKVYFGNTAWYLSIINFLLLLLTSKKVYNINIPAYILLPIGFFGALTIGFLDYKFVYKHQLKHINKMNDIKMVIDRIEQRLINK